MDWEACSVETKKILFASRNAGKQAEAKKLFADLDVDLLFPDEIPELDGIDPEENGETFFENALIKAKEYALLSQLPSIADDSGIIIDGLGGLPGVASNRWYPGSGDDRNAEVLRRLSEDKPRTARYMTVACFFDPQSEEYASFSATQEGSIAKEPFEGEGFDYDKIFIPEGKNETFSVLGNDYKNSISQRARAFGKLHEYLKERLALK